MKAWILRLRRKIHAFNDLVLAPRTKEHSQMQDIFPATRARIEEWKAQPEVLGVLLVGSKSRGYNDELSDDDLEVVLMGEAHSRLAPTECSALLVEGEGPTRRLIYDAEYTSLPDLSTKAHSTHDLDHWPYERVVILFDRDGRVSKAVEVAARMDPDFRHKRLLHGTIDAWTAPYRASKAIKRGYDAAGRLLIARGVRALTRVVFALEWRWSPLEHWWEPELKTLDDPTGAGPAMVRALLESDPAILQAALDNLEDRLFSEGVPRRAGRHDLFLELIHPARAEERAIHAVQ